MHTEQLDTVHDDILNITCDWTCYPTPNYMYTAHCETLYLLIEAGVDLQFRQNKFIIETASNLSYAG